MNIPKDIVERIKSVSKLEDVIVGLVNHGKQSFSKCPKCHHLDTRKKTGLIYNPEKEIAKCFKCGWGVNSPITYLMDVQGKTYPEALEVLAGIHHIEIEDEQSRLSRLENKKEQKEKKLS